MMYVLVVEDEAEFVAELKQVFSELGEQVELAIAGSRDVALDFLARKFFDLIVLDLKIPTIDSALDADPRHGHAVFAQARIDRPGTPVLILTGSPAEDFIPTMLAQQQNLDVWSVGKQVGTVEFLKKSRFDECPAKLKPIASAVNRLAEVELERLGCDLTIQEDRLIRIFAKKVGGTRCVVSQIGGGLSGAKVVRLRVTDRAGARVHDAVAKLGQPATVREEEERFDGQVSRLDPGATPRRLATLYYGAGDLAGIFYGLADGFDSTAFEIAAGDERSAKAVQSVQLGTRKWSDGVPESRRSIREIRQQVVPDATLERVLTKFSIPWIQSFETENIQTRWTCVHGDLHGSNILVSSNGTSVLIDYGDVGDGPASTDPVTLELSLVFHPNRPKLEPWPSPEQARRWGTPEAYLEGCAAGDFIRACREWARAASAGKREIAAAAYSYLMRQLKYEDTDKDMALALLQGVKAFYDET